MPILDRFNGDDKPQKPAAQEPDIIKGRPGFASYSMAALEERVEAEFEAEVAGRQDILLDAQDEAARLALVAEVVEYVAAVESLPLTPAERQALTRRVYHNLFMFGPLADLLADDTVTEIRIEGFERLHVRRSMGPPERIPSGFRDPYHLARVVERMLTGAGAMLREDVPFIEVGLTVQGRPVRLGLVAPPYSSVLHLDLRVHQPETYTLAGFAAQGGLSPVDLEYITTLARSDYGVLVVGDVASGKTALLEAMLHALPEPAGTVLVERAAEVRPPAGMHRLAAFPGTDAAPEVPFATQIEAALQAAPAVLAIDELRSEEAGAVWAVLTAEPAPRPLLVMRSSAESARLHSAFGIFVRKAQPAVSQEAIDQLLLERLPFVVAVRFAEGRVQVSAIGQWQQAQAGQGGMVLEPVVARGERTGAALRFPLP